ncbi:MAG: molecular chaperone SurA [Labilithrix sp.]|nr:molecular chaperone SurA [Labilithrix sp.]
MNIAALILAASLFAQAKAAAPAGAAKPVLLDGVVAVVEDVTFFRSDVAQRLRHIESKLSKDATERRAQQKELSRQIVRKLIEEVLISKDCARMRLEVGDAEVAQGIATVARTNKLDPKQLEAEVVSAGYSPEEYREEIRHEILEQKWLLVRSAGKVDRAKLTDPAALDAAFEKQRELLLNELRAHAYIEVR